MSHSFNYKFLVISVVLLALLSSCGSRETLTPSIVSTKSITATSTVISTQPPPSETFTLTPLPTRTQTHIPTVTKTQTPTPTIDIARYKDILTIYPLAVGEERVYEMTITYAITYTEDNALLLDEWKGLVHEKVVGQYATKNGIGFDLNYPDYPDVSSFPFGGGEIGNYTKRLEFRENSVYEVYGDGDKQVYIQILDFPLEEGKNWLAFTSDPYYKWIVGEKTDITTPAGHFTDCYHLFLNTNPDTTEIVFCNGVGFIYEYAWHHPAVWLYEMILSKMP